MSLRWSFGVGACLALCACGGRRLPPGTLPPEYEPPQLAPWSAESADSGSAGHAESQNDAPVPAPAPASPELSLDAGAR